MPAPAADPAADPTLPQALVVGAEKCGTSTLTGLIDAHPDGFVCTPKEPHFFSRDDQWDRGVDWYRSLFEPGRAAAVRAEGSVTIAYASRSERAIPRIREVLGDPAIVFIARHPVRRIESRWRMRQSFEPAGGRESFEQFVRDRWDYLIDNSRYAERLAPFAAAFGRVSVLLFEDLVADRDAVVRRLYEAVGLDASFRPEAVHRNRPAAVRERDAVTRLRQSAAYRAVRDWLPPGLRSQVASRTRVTVDHAFAWPPDLLAEVENAVRDDAAAFLRSIGRPAEFWAFGSQPPGE